MGSIGTWGWLKILNMGRFGVLVGRLYEIMIVEDLGGCSRKGWDINICKLLGLKGTWRWVNILNMGRCSDKRVL